MSTRTVTPPGVASGYCRLAFALVSLFGVAACSDAPTDGTFDPTAAFAPPTAPAVTHVACDAMNAGSLSGNKYVRVRVLRSGGTLPAVGAVVSAISPTLGPLCWGTTSSDGYISLNNLKKDAAILLSIRDEVSNDAPRLEIVPPDPLVDLTLFDDPTDAGARQAAALVGGTACTTQQLLTWPSWDALRTTPCIIPGSNFDLSFTLTATSPVTATVLAPDGTELPGVIVGAVSPATFTAAQIATECAKYPWVDQTQCSSNSHGPALLQAMDLTDTNGQVMLGVAKGTGLDIVFEAIGDYNGQTLFGTIIGGGTTSLLSPGMCYVDTVDDDSEPSGMADVDIDYTKHSVGLLAEDNDPDLPGPELIALNNSLIVAISVDSYNDGGDGTFDIKFRLPGSTDRYTMRSSFSIPAPGGESCSVGASSGNGTGVGASLTGTCAPVPGSPNNDYIVYYTLNLPAPPDEATYDVDTEGDHLDPSRSDPSYARGSVTFLNLNQSSCPIRFNNDARWTSGG